MGNPSTEPLQLIDISATVTDVYAALISFNSDKALDTDGVGPRIVLSFHFNLFVTPSYVFNLII